MGDAHQAQKWEPLSVREGRAEPDGPFEGIPDHLRQSLEDWLTGTLEPGHTSDRSLVQRVALRLRINVGPNTGRLTSILAACDYSDSVFLDALDCTLFLDDGQRAEALEMVLAAGGSIWTVNGTRDGLVRRVTAGEQASYVQAVSQADSAAEHLGIAWVKVYGLHPDYSDAWDHAIKACEALLCPIVKPTDAKATLGSVIAGIRDKSSKYTFRLAGAPNGVPAVGTFQGMLELMWPNPDRHESGPSRAPTPEEARDVLHLAVLVVNLVRNGAFGKADAPLGHTM